MEMYLFGFQAAAMCMGAMSQRTVHRALLDSGLRRSYDHEMGRVSQGLGSASAREI